MPQDSPTSIFAAVFAWFTPAVLFLLLNIVIGTIAIAIASKSSHQQPATADDSAGAGRSLARSLSRSPSVVFDRLRTFSRHHFFYGEILPPVGAETGIASEEPHTAPEAEQEGEDEVEFHQPLSRSQSDTHPAAGEMPPKLEVRMKKSASDNSAFAHFKEEDVEEAATATATMEAVDPPPAERERGEEVDARSEDFINRFRQQLQLQRLESILRYKEMVHRGS